MKLIILDYFRRKGLALLGGAILEFVVGMFPARFGADHVHSLGTLQVQISIFMGAFLLSIDLQRGIARTMISLPVTVGQIARAWWFATVGITSAILIACLFAGAGLSVLIHPGIGVDWPWLALAAIFLFLWMGSSFPLVFLASGPGFFYGNGWQRGANVTAGLLWGGMVGGGMWLFQDLESHWLRMSLMLLFGIGLTTMGWFGAEKCVIGRASFKIGALAGRHKQGPWRLQGGYGGIPYLLSATCIRALYIGLAMVGVMALVFWTQGGSDWRDISKELLGMGFLPFWFVVFFAYLPLLMQLRFLRSLPVSPSLLSAVMVMIVSLPLLLMGAITAAIAGPFLGLSASLILVNNFMLMLPVSVMSLILTLWLRYGRLSFVLMFMLIILFQSLPLWLHFGLRDQQIPLAAGIAIAVAAIVIGWQLARLLLVRNSKIYRSSATMFGNATWLQGR